MPEDAPSVASAAGPWPSVRIVCLLTLSLLICLTVFTAAQIARTTRYNVHPDEYAHVDALCYFASHTWPPDLGADGLKYSPYGWSRVYTGELVYLLYGRLYAAMMPFMRDDSEPSSATVLLPADRRFSVFLPLVMGETGLACQLPRASVMAVFRFLNVALLFVTLVVLLLAGRRHLWAGLAALLMMCVPQVIYLYSYANSDAWGLSVSLFLIAFVLVRGDRLLRSLWSILTLAALTGAVLLSKETFWLAIPFACLFAGQSLLRSGRAVSELLSRRWVGALILVVSVTLVIVAPLRLYYPRTQGDFAAGVERMREARAAPGYHPGQPTAPGYRLAQRGEPFSAIAAQPWWYERSAQSAYGVFGYMNVEPPDAVLWAAAGLFLSLAAATYLFAARRWRALPESVRLGLAVAPAFVALALLVSLFNSWRVDVQPQGRYLFGALLPAAVMLAGAVAAEPRWLQRCRALAFIALYMLCQIVLWSSVLGNPALTG